MMRSRHNSVRAGFTLVELMISAAITVMIMTILSICFQTSMKAMSAMRAQGDAADQLRAVGEVIKRDVDATHFLPSDPGSNGNTAGSRMKNRGRRVSDYEGVLPRAGFFQLQSPDSTSEGNDGVFNSYRNIGCSIWMTAVLTGGSEGNLFTASIPASPPTIPQPLAISSEAAEVAYFLRASGEFTATQAPLYNLYRRQRLVAVDVNKQTQFNNLLNDPNPFIRGVAQTFISTSQLNATQANRMDTLYAASRPGFPNPLGTPGTGGTLGDDIILSNVLSFEIKPTWAWTAAGAPRTPRPYGLNAGQTTDFPFDNLGTPTGSNVFDLVPPLPGTNGTAPSYYINAVQVRLRIYDPKARTARQTTFVFDL